MKKKLRNLNSTLARLFIESYTVTYDFKMKDGYWKRNMTLRVEVDLRIHGNAKCNHDIASQIAAKQIKETHSLNSERDYYISRVSYE